MTDQTQDHPTQGRRRRHKSPACLPDAQRVLLPRQLDHISSRLPREYDEVMGITQVEPGDAERFEEGNDSDFQDAEEVATRETDTGDRIGSENRGPGETHGGYAVPP